MSTINLKNVGYFVPPVPPLMPDNMTLFWDMWNTHKKPLIKTKSDGITDDLIKNQSQSSPWEGMVVYARDVDSYQKQTAWSQTPILTPSLWNPFIEELHLRLPWFKTEVIMLWSSTTTIPYHNDTFPLYPGPVAVRSVIYDENPNPTFRVQHDESEQEQFVPYNVDRNIFAFNNVGFKHGATYEEGKTKILMRALGTLVYPNLLLKQIEETKEKGFPIWEVENVKNSE